MGFGEIRKIIYLLLFLLSLELSCPLNCTEETKQRDTQAGSEKQKNSSSYFLTLLSSHQLLFSLLLFLLFLAVLSQRSFSNKVKNYDLRDSPCNIWEEVSGEKCPSLRL